MNYPFRFKIGERVIVDAEHKQYAGEVGYVHALELNATTKAVIIKRTGDKGPIRVSESMAMPL